MKFIVNSYNMQNKTRTPQKTPVNMHKEHYTHDIPALINK